MYWSYLQNILILLSYLHYISNFRKTLNIKKTPIHAVFQIFRRCERFKWVYASEVWEKIQFCFRYPLCISKHLKNDGVSVVIWIDSLFSERPAAGADFFLRISKYITGPAGESPKKITNLSRYPPLVFYRIWKQGGISVVIWTDGTLMDQLD